ncbi:MAG: hypothetical protein FWD17_19620, partial [Polyangiaceae bacterium]|nr:hypothetical protein [Polyangiaceae bacterium]
PLSGWEYWQAARCTKCGAAYVNNSFEPGDSHACACEVPEVGGPAGERFRFYPLPGWVGGQEVFVAEAAEALVDVPVCVVRVGKEYGLAPTDAERDLWWPLCEAYMRLEYLPPWRFAICLPPSAAPHTESEQWVFDACNLSVDLAKPQ